MRRFFLFAIKPRQATAQHVLKLRNIYILPTRSGFMLLATLALLLLTSINFQLNLGYALTFLIAGAAFASTFTAYRTVRGLKLNIAGIASVFANQSLPFTVSVDNPDLRPRYGIGLAIYKHKLKYQLNEWVWLDAPARETATVTLSVPTTQRGWQSVPQIVIQTHFPLGVFRVWSIWKPSATALVYPAPEEKPPLLPTDQSHEHGARNERNRQQGSEYDGNRPYRPGDPLKQIVWKKILPNGDLVSKQMSAMQGNELWLSLGSTRLSELEAQLSRLTSWILLASSLDMAYGLQLGSVRVPVSTGEAHEQRCLRELALYMLPSQRHVQEYGQEKEPVS